MGAHIRIRKAGLLTTVQDTGRPGHLHQGIALSGAADNRAFRLTQALVGNAVGQPLLVPGDPGAAGLEFTLQGPTIEFSDDTAICLGGVAVDALLDGAPVPMWTVVRVRAGGTLQIKRVSEGIRGYLSILGGIDCPTWLGSRATLLSAAQGGAGGRQLQVGDVLPIGDQVRAEPAAGAVLPPDLVPIRAAEIPVLRTVISAQADLIEDDSRAEFFASSWRLTPLANRVASRFAGPVTKYRPRPDHVRRDAGDGDANVVDDVNALGAVQVPGGGQAIVFGVDLTSTGGYAHIGTVISEDIGVLAQLRPGQDVRFHEISADEGVAIFRRREEPLQSLITSP
jgi:biotin-dependent carboxylase-like uncharacterized protein